MNSSPKISQHWRPETESDICQLANRLLHKAGVVNLLPTPVDEIITAVGVENVEDTESLKNQFLASLPKTAWAILDAAWDKIRGIADLRDKVVYVAKATTAPRVHFAKCHELGHQVIPWHKVNVTYRDDDCSLIDEVEDLFDVEANFFAAEIIFQGEHFTKKTRDYKPSFAAVFLLADEHGASRHATLHRYIEEHDETLAAIPYWPSRYTIDEYGYPVLRAGKLVCSPRFMRKYADIQLPYELRTGHEWLSARDMTGVSEGSIRLDSGAGPVSFQWQSWWNGYCLLLLLRKKPMLSLVGQLVVSRNKVVG